MNADFDHSAPDYDRDFTFTMTGRLLRQNVLRYVYKNIIKDGRIAILEINCGTGEDAIHFYRNGNTVYATDISSAMIRVAKEKAGNIDDQRLTFHQLSFAELPQEWMKGKFDLVFSDFGGLNCISEDEFRSFFLAAEKVLKPGGRLVGVIMPRYCLWEMIYFSLKGQWNKALRRKSTGPVLVDVAGAMVSTWYYSPKMIKKMAEDFEIIASRPVGLFLPPSFLEGFFHTKKRLLKIFSLLEGIFNKFSVFAGISDHFLIDLKKTNNSG